MSPSEIASLLVCPTCHGDLEQLSRCRSCGRAFGQVAGIPALCVDAETFAPKVNAAMDHHVSVRQRTRRTGLRRIVDRAREATSTTVFGDDRTQVDLLTKQVASLAPTPGLLLDVGGGEQPYRTMLERLGRVVTLDVSPYGVTDVIADGHTMPFRDDSLDAISIISVLEHLERPWDFFREAARVLRPGGYLFGVAPQYCPTHGFPHDFFRFTRGGITSLCKHASLGLTDAWPIGGPWGTLLHWYWANEARESPLRRIPAVSLAYHVWFQGLAGLLDRLDARSAHGAMRRPQEHNDHVGWSFIAHKQSRA